MRKEKIVAGRGGSMNYGNGIRHQKNWILSVSLVLVVLFLWSGKGYAQSEYLPLFTGKYPAATALNTCLVCHQATVTGGRSNNRNGYGSAWSSAGGDVAAFGAIEGADSDGDGFTNIVEITAGTFPGNATSVPASAALSITTASPLPAGTVGTVYSQTFATTGGTAATRTWSVSAGTLPAGLSLSSAGVLSGTPTTAATSSFTVQVTGGGTATKAFSVTINPAAPTTGAVTTTPADGASDVPVNTVVTARIGSGDIRTIFNKDTFTLKPSAATSDSSEERSGALANTVCVSGGVVQGSISYNDSRTRARFTPNCPLEHNMMYVGEIASGVGSSSQTFRFTTAVERPDSDDDGGDDGEDDHDNDRRRTGRWSPHGTGRIHIDAGEDSRRYIRESMAISDTSLRLNPDGKPAGVEFPDGLVSFQAEGVARGTSATFKVTFPSGIAAGSKVYQVDTGGFHEVAGAVIAGDTVTMTVTNTDAEDGGVLVDPVGVAAPAASETGSIDLTSASGGGGCSVAGRTGSRGSDIDGALILAGLGLTVWGIRIRRRRG